MGCWTKNQLLSFVEGMRGIDERFIENYVHKEFSIGDFVLSGGEIPALALIDALSRKIPGVLGNQESFKNDSFENNLLKGPVYTRPQKFEGKDVPGILLSGDHEKINDWKILSSLQRTIERRPDLLDLSLIHISEPTRR